VAPHSLLELSAESAPSEDPIVAIDRLVTRLIAAPRPAGLVPQAGFVALGRGDELVSVLDRELAFVVGEGAALRCVEQPSPWSAAVTEALRMATFEVGGTIADPADVRAAIDRIVERLGALLDGAVEVQALELDGDGAGPGPFGSIFDASLGLACAGRTYLLALGWSR
jgi:hypothetical protein